MQAAYWVGRHAAGPLGGVAAHLYAEFDGCGIDVARLRRAVRALFQTHGMLRLSVDADGLQTIRPLEERHGLVVENLCHLDDASLSHALTAKREAKTHQRLNLGEGEAIDLSLSLLPDGRFRLHVDLDMIAADPSSFRVLMEDLARFYEEPMLANQPPSVSYFDYLSCLRTKPDAAQRRDQDRQWWQARLAQMPPAPPLPWRDAMETTPIRSERFAARLEATERQALEHAARRHGVTLSTLMLALFALTLGTHTGAQRFRLNVPMFYRHRCLEDVDRLLGDFSELLILGVDLDAKQSLLELCQCIAGELAQLISHAVYPGVSVMRNLSRQQGGMQLAPVVFTSGLNMPGGELFSERVTRRFGEMTWVISQAPQVALDAQAAAVDGGILVNWDVRLDALPTSWVQPFFEDYLTCLRLVVGSSDRLTTPLVQAFPILHERRVAKTIMETPLTPLQQAYLMGRREHLPLGGVAMQEFREYRGRIVTEELRRRLARLVRRHDALRTRIDEDRLVQRVDPDPVTNLEELDLRVLTPAEAWQQVDTLREDYTHRLCDPSRSPWHLLLIQLPPDAADSHVLFARFDALILDGQGIAAILTELLAEQDFPAPVPAGEAIRIDAGNRDTDAAYWTARLQSFTGPMRLPWLKPLASIKASRYRREHLMIPREHLTALSRLGAQHGLFRNAILSTLILDVLARWCEEGTMCVAVPVALPQAGQLSNASSFIPLLYDPTSGSLEDRARRVQTSILEGLEHLAFSGVDLNRLLLSRHPDGPPLPVVLTNALSWPKLRPDGPVRLQGGLTQTPQTAMDIRLTLDEWDNLELCIDYAEQALSPALVRDLLHAMGKALEAVARRGVLDLQARDFIDHAHYRHNGKEEDFICSSFLQRIAQHLFETGADKTALICGKNHISYGQLGRNVAAIMHGLDQRGLRKGNIVAICLPRGPEHVTVTLACALLGILWVPVDAGSPPDRLRVLLDTCRPDLVVGEENIDGLEMVAPQMLVYSIASEYPVNSQSLAELSRSENAAYYLFTSGTTGKPKCVVLCNRATSNVIGHTQTLWQVGPQDVFISVTPLHHDMSVFDVFGALSAGATLVLPAPGEEKDAVAWNRLVQRYGVTVWCSVPAILEMLLTCRQSDELRSLRLIAQGGDYIKPATIAALRTILPECRLFSLGGPTETTIWSIWHEITAEDEAIIPYGRPLPGSRYYLLNDAGEHCPAGVVGRIHTAGVSLSLGYLEDGVLTRSDFVTILNEHNRPIQAFRTGDLGRYREDGTLLFAGRVNGYVKVRGVRISLPDIENELSKHENIQSILVTDFGDARTGEIALGALYVGAEMPVAELRSFARHQLPDSHVPSRFLRVPELPLTGNGKPDRARARTLLFTGAGASPAPDAISAQPPTHAQQILGIYLGVIGKQHREDVGEETAFLDLGLLPSHLRSIATGLREAFGVDLSPGLLARCRNARQVQALLQNVPQG